MKLRKDEIKAKLDALLQEKLAERHTDLLVSAFQEDCGCPEGDNGTDEDDCDCEDCKENMIDVDFDEETGEHSYTELDEETLTERRIVIRVNSRGQRIKRIKCPPGRIVKTVGSRKVCVTQKGRERLKKRIAIRRANRTKKAKGTGYKKRVNFKRQRAIRKRRQMGLK